MEAWFRLALMSRQLKFSYNYAMTNVDLIQVSELALSENEEKTFGIEGQGTDSVQHEDFSIIGENNLSSFCALNEW